jgi:hypothetical protein
VIRPAPFFLAAVTLALLAPVAGAQQGRKPKEDQSNPPASAFSDAERETIAAYFAAHSHDVRPLPPGTAKNLARGKPLPPGIAKQRLPADLGEQLPIREGFEITIFGDRIVLLEASGLVVDILEDIFR